ncbi:MAG TPA: SigB/SigF/SigG family RNA polymerase sigma factor [Pseudonocardiaceae bacterium]|nr:SigB/SigF/SigG family RNA polymerase sigma factor [Pseudonocardiaceae bacterium]
MTEREHEYQSLAPLFHQMVDDSASVSRRRTIREHLVTAHLPVAEHIALRFRDRGQPAEDLTQVATVGLIHAVDRFDPDRGTDFLSFAVPTITGEVRRYFRDATWAVRVPRRLKELHALVSTASVTLGQRLGRSPRSGELASELGIDVDDVHEGLQVGYAYRGESLDAGSDGTGSGISTETDSRLGVTDPSLIAVEDRETLYPALAMLPEREAAIVMMRFFGHLTQTQIAERMGVSQMHVSRLLAASIADLRESIVDGAV